MMQLASCVNNQPWLCNVWYVMDEEDNVYWMSRKTRRHSQEIEQNPNIACTFHKWFDEGLGQKGQALVIAGKAELLTGEGCRMPYELYAERYPALYDFQTLDDFLKDEGDHFFYKLSPEEFMWWDDFNFGDVSRQYVRL